MKYGRVADCLIEEDDVVHPVDITSSDPAQIYPP